MPIFMWAINWVDLKHSDSGGKCPKVIFSDTEKSYKIQVSVSMNKVLLDRQPLFFMYIWTLTILTLLQDEDKMNCNFIHPSKPKIFTFVFFTKIFADHYFKYLKAILTSLPKCDLTYDNYLESSNVPQTLNILETFLWSFFGTS